MHQPLHPESQREAYNTMLRVMHYSSMTLLLTIRMPADYI
jgi:hypothetical protein